jgi:hypothetical protein
MLDCTYKENIFFNINLVAKNETTLIWVNIGDILSRGHRTNHRMIYFCGDVL